MKRRIFDWLYTVLERLLLLVDGRAPTKVRLKAVKAVAPAVVAPAFRTQRISKERAGMRHHCVPPGNMLPWAGGTWYCPRCRAMRTYVPLSLPREEAIAPHYVPRVRGRHNGHLRSISGVLVDTGKLVVPGREI